MISELESAIAAKKRLIEAERAVEYAQIRHEEALKACNTPFNSLYRALPQRGAPMLHYFDEQVWLIDLIDSEGGIEIRPVLWSRDYAEEEDTERSPQGDQMSEISLTLSIGFNGEHSEVMPLESALVEMDLLHSEWDELSDSERQDKLDQLWKTWAFQYINGSATVIS